jgi:hypothetical protein
MIIVFNNSKIYKTQTDNFFKKNIKSNQLN